MQNPNNQTNPSQGDVPIPVAASGSITTSHLTFPLTIRNRRTLLFNDQVKAISSLNNKGKFDVLPHHGNFISLIKEYLIIYKTDGTTQGIKIENGVIYVKRSTAHCYINLLSEAIPQVTQSNPQA